MDAYKTQYLITKTWHPVQKSSETTYGIISGSKKILSSGEIIKYEETDHSKIRNGDIDFKKFKEQTHGFLRFENINQKINKIFPITPHSIITLPNGKQEANFIYRIKKDTFDESKMKRCSKIFTGNENIVKISLSK